MKNYKKNLGFDTDKYITHQSIAIKNILRKTHDKLYIEFGGKLIQDKHCARVLPGYNEDAKIELIKNLCENGELVFVVSAKDILRGRIRGDFKTTYDDETFRTIKEFDKRGLKIKHVVISLLQKNEPIDKKIQMLEQKLQQHKITTYRFFEIKNYQAKESLLKNLEINPFINIANKLILIISPGGGSGKFGICLNQLYYEMLDKKTPRYLKFETFPVHDLPIEHPLNLAYMSASADFYDIVMKDKRHGKATSYNRDLENYELLNFIAKKFEKYGKYLLELSSATNMGINMLSKGIIDDEIVQKEAAAEIARRLIRYKFEVQQGKEDIKTLNRVKKIITML